MSKDLTLLLAGSNTIAQADYGLEDVCYELNLESARLGKRFDLLRGANVG